MVIKVIMVNDLLGKVHQGQSFKDDNRVIRQFTPIHKYIEDNS